MHKIKREMVSDVHFLSDDKCNYDMKEWSLDMFQSLYDRYFRVLVGYAVRFVKSDAEAEDIVQEVFTMLWTRPESFTDHHALMNLLYTSVRNRCIDHLRHLSVEQAYASDAAMETEEDMETEIFAGEIYSRLFAYIDELPLRQRTTMQLVISGKKNAEIAEEMSISIETVKKQKQRAISTLRSLFVRDENLVLLALFESIIKV